MSINSVFYPGAVPDQIAAAFMKTPYWPVASGAHYKLDGKLFVSKIAPTMDICYMSDVNGFPVLRIWGHSTFKIAVNEGLDSTRLFSSNTIVADTANTRYLLARFADQSKLKRKATLRESIFKACERANTAYANAIQETLTRYTAREHPYLSVADFAISVEAQEWALLLAYGGKQMVEVPSHIKPILDKAYNMHVTKHTRLDTFVAAASDVLDREKWVATYMPEYGYLCAKIHGRELVSHCKRQASTQFPIPLDPNKLSYVEQPRYYPDLNAMPEQQRREFVAALAVAKANRSEGIIKDYLDRDNLIPNLTSDVFLSQPRIGALARRLGQLTWVMVDA